MSSRRPRQSECGDVGKPLVHSGRVRSRFFSDGMIVTFDEPCRTIARQDTLNIRTQEGDVLEIFPAAIRPDGAVSVWYAPHPLLRHWLGWMAPIDDTHWSFRMEALHIDILRDIPELCERVTAQAS
jgi:hypothetical protein